MPRNALCLFLAELAVLAGGESELFFKQPGEVLAVLKTRLFCNLHHACAGAFEDFPRALELCILHQLGKALPAVLFDQTRKMCIRDRGTVTSPCCPGRGAAQISIHTRKGQRGQHFFKQVRYRAPRGLMVTA